MCVGGGGGKRGGEGRGDGIGGGGRDLDSSACIYLSILLCWALFARNVSDPVNDNWAYHLSESA